MIEIAYWAFALIATAVYAVVRFLIYLKKRKFEVGHELKCFGFFAYILLLSRGVCFPWHSLDGRAVRAVIDFDLMFPPNINLKPFTFVNDFYPGWFINVFGNIILFIPVGIFFPWLTKRINSFAKTVLAGFGFTMIIETLQLFLYDRCSDVDDLILNTLGATIGAGIYFLGRKAFSQRKQK